MADNKIFEDLVEFLKQKRENVTFIDIIRLAEIASQSLQGATLREWISDSGRWIRLGTPAPLL